MLRCLVPLVLALTACSGTARVVRLNTGQGEPVVFTPRVRGEPVKLEEGEVKRVLAHLARELHVPVAPQEAARRLFEVGERSGWYQYDPLGQRITPLGSGAHLPTEWSAADAELIRNYLARCERRGTPGDCLRLLVESPTLTGDGRYALAMSFAEGVVLDEMEAALRGMANREAVLTAVLWTCTTYLLLLTVPEPVSKGIAAVMTAAFIAWVGFDTFWSLLVGFKYLVEDADRATTFAELRQAGERYGKVMGRNAARAFVMLATAAIGSTAAGLAMKVPTLPGAAQAATQAGMQLGIRLSAVGGVTAVAVSADAVTISVAAGAVMPMGASKTSDGPTGGIAAPIRWKGFSKGKLAAHFQKHGAEFGPMTQAQYLQTAKDFAAEAGAGFQEGQIGNLVVKYDPATRRVFVGHVGDREIRTFYRAESGSHDPFKEAIELARELSQG